MALTDDINIAAVTEELPERAPRKRVLKKGKILFDGGTRSYPVMIRNISETGARIQFTDPQPVPQEFLLQVELDNFRVPCRRVWDEGLLHGVQFTGAREQLGEEMTQALQASDALRQEALRKAAAVQPVPDTPRSQPTHTHRPARPGFGRRGG